MNLDELQRERCPYVQKNADGIKFCDRLNTLLNELDALLNERELATVLAALRHWQRVGGPKHCMDWQESDLFVKADDTTIAPLNLHEIDKLCERINVVKETR